MSKRLPVVLVVAVLLAGTAQAQAPLLTQPLDSGTLVRLHFLPGGVARGRLLTPFAPDSQRMLFCNYSSPPCESRATPAARSVLVTAIRRVDVVGGTRAARGAFVGAIVGAATGYLTAGFAGYGCECNRGAPPAYVIGGIVGGALWGAFIGSMVKIWKPAH